jgi:hypothetical protein
MKKLNVIVFIIGIGITLLQAAPVGWNNSNADSEAAAVDPAGQLTPNGSLDLSPTKKTTEAEDLFTPLRTQRRPRQRSLIVPLNQWFVRKIDPSIGRELRRYFQVRSQNLIRPFRGRKKKLKPRNLIALFQKNPRQNGLLWLEF